MFSDFFTHHSFLCLRLLLPLTVYCLWVLSVPVRDGCFSSSENAFILLSFLKERFDGTWFQADPWTSLSGVHLVCCAVTSLPLWLGEVCLYLVVIASKVTCPFSVVAFKTASFTFCSATSLQNVCVHFLLFILRHSLPFLNLWTDIFCYF